MSKSLAGKIAVVTGASRGIGRSIPETLAAEGAVVAVHYGKSKAGADEVVAKIKAAGGEAFAVGADLSKKGAAQALFAGLDQELSKRNGDTKFDILVNNAGIAPFVSFADTTEDVLDEIYTVNVRVPLLHHAGSRQTLERWRPHHLDVVGRRSHAASGRRRLFDAQSAARQPREIARRRARTSRYHGEYGGARS